MVLETLIETRRILRKRGWIQGRSESPNGVCLSQAISIACRRTDTYYAKVSRVIRPELPTTLQDSIILYNDHPDRTKREVFSLLNRAISKQFKTLPFRQRVIKRVTLLFQ